MLVPVTVLATRAKARPVSVPPVSVMDPTPLLPARMLPLTLEVVSVAAEPTAQYTLHGCPRPVMTTEKLVPVSAAPTLKIQTPLAGR
ncbi:hypothetical protein BI344_17655 [Chromobacterium sphagni]|uniref:Secreted protein n=1 Tax=Chromobacterium sphagni TaxID=1903179 RepID=A0ABX3CBD7_9NEIS|nr:hypothetical protein [Chromobacterium sphagni]OHX19610.1 hypothetical protein BI344_17655 [Chromobacterium sphagni]